MKNQSQKEIKNQSQLHYWIITLSLINEEKLKVNKDICGILNLIILPFIIHESKFVWLEMLANYSEFTLHIQIN